jgi:hypothetical protein
VSLTSDRSSVRVAGALVTVIGTTGPISATWAVEVDGVEVVREKITGGERTLQAPLPDGSFAEVEIHQGALGPTRVTVRHLGIVVGEFNGFVA